MARTKTDKNRTLVLGPTFGALALIAASCATYEGATSLHTYGAEIEAGTAGDSTTGLGGMTAAGGGTAAGATSGASSGGATVSAGGSSAGTASSGAAAGTGGSPSNGGSQSTGGSVGNGGTNAGGNVGSGGNAGSGGATPSGGTGGGGGTGSIVDHLLSQGKPASADSEETAKGNLAALGNDGLATTRWCAADGAVGHYWQVDLGATDTISKLEVTWEKAAIYKFKIEGSKDNSVWLTLVDQTASTTGTADQVYTLATAGSARYVRITVTGLANSTTWASFFELAVWGH